MKNILKSILLLFLIISCTSKKHIVEKPIETIEVTSTKPEITITDRIAQGESLYQNKCGNCHALPKVKDHSPENWKLIMLRMQKEARISDSERENIYNYIVMQ